MTTQNWHPDPWQRAQFRFHDGQRWTEQISNNGVVGTDPDALSMPVPPPVHTPGVVAAPSASAPVTIHVGRKRHPFRWLLLGGVALVAVIAAVSAGSKDGGKASSSGSSTGATSNGVSRGVGSRDASADVTGLEVSEPDQLGFREVVAHITNRSSKRSDYYIEVAIESADGSSQLDTASMFANSLEPGQSADAKSLPIRSDLPADAKVTLKKVSRTASS